MSLAVSEAPQLRELVKKIWGYSEFLPCQEEAMQDALEGRDSLVVLPTGGGKSLCYQAPAALQEGTAVVISPLIALMKDQVDGLGRLGVASAYLNSSLTRTQQAEIEAKVSQGSLKLLYIAPERFSQPGFLDLLRKIKISAFVIDEAHCISHWGHDFRPEYRQLSLLRREFPNVSIHAFTATATEQVRQDIVGQLALRSVQIRVGNFDRPNLIYRALPRQGVLDQILQVLDRHKGESGIIYAIRRTDVEELCEKLKAKGIAALPYHAGMSASQRSANQEAFTREEAEVIVATVAFGMGINRSNVRYVIHAALPKSIEHYQQEAGRAGRDGLEAECILFYSGADFSTWKFIMEKEASATFYPDLKKLSAMLNFARGGFCRHSYLSAYFGQQAENLNCKACDFCLGEMKIMPDSTLIAKKIISCVYRVEQRFGADYVADVLRGAETAKIKQNKHETLSTYGLLKEHSKKNIRLWIDQLLSQELLARGEGDYPTLSLTADSEAVLKDQAEVRLSVLAEPKQVKKKDPSTTLRASWEGVDRSLFDQLRALRRQIAQELNVPPYLIFGDKTLREMARQKPADFEAMAQVWGVGARKLESFGARFLSVIKSS